MLFKKFLITLGFLSLQACLSTIDSTHLQTPTPVPEDTAYFKIYTESSQQFDFIDKFETKFKIHITQLTPAFRRALAKRHEQIFLEPQPLLTEASQKLAFFVTIYSKDHNLTDISDERLWTLQLRTGSSILKPSLIKPLAPKERWVSFFPDINVWSTEYLILFDVAPAVNQPDALTAVSEFILASPEGSITSRW